MKAATEYEGIIGGVPAAIFFPALFALCLETGERMGAIRSLRREDIDLRGRWITYNHRKMQGDPLVKQISRTTAKAIGHLLAACPHETPFGHVHATTLYFHYKRILRAAGLPDDRRSMLHRLRRTHASYLQLRGGNPTISLGHSSDAVTKRHYLDARIVKGKEAIDYLFSPFSLGARLKGMFGR
jgi:integrase